MSRGPGHIERGLEAIMRDANRSFTVEELARLVYPNIAEVKKKHRVAILRAFTNVEQRTPLWFFRTHTAPWRLIVTNRNNVRSYGHGLLRYSWWNAERTLDDIEKILSDPDIVAVMQPGGLWWTDVEITKAEGENCILHKAATAAGVYVDDGKGSFSWSDLQVYDQWCGSLNRQLFDLRTHRNWMAKNNTLHVLLGKFEPPGTPVFEYAMKARALIVAQAEVV